MQDADPGAIAADAGMGDVFVILNPKAGRAAPDEVRAALASAFEPLRWRWRVHDPGPGDPGPDGLRAAVAEAIRQGAKRILAAGGDGTVSVVADAMAAAGDHDAELAIIPLGTANILAKDLRIPMDIPAAILLVISGNRTIDIDALELGGRHYFTQIGAGPDALMIEETTREAQQKLGRLAYFLAFFRRAFGHRSERFEFTIDGRKFRLRAWQVVIANAATLGLPPFVWGPQVDPGDGIADLCVYNVRGPSDYLRALWTLVWRRHREDSNARFFRIRRSITVSTARPRPVQADGEIIGDTPIEVKVVPKAVRVLAPATAPGEESAIEPRRQHLKREALRKRWDDRVATIGHVDAAVFLWINKLPRRPWLDALMTAVSRSMPHGEGWLLFLLIGLLVDPGHGAHAALAVIPALWLTTLTVNYPIKAMFRRTRPFLKHQDVVVIGPRPSDHSFPSGHTAAAFAGALLMTLHYPAWAPAWYALALVVGFSRVYLGVHFPLDVAMGAVFGMVLAAAWEWVLGLVIPALR